MDLLLLLRDVPDAHAVFENGVKAIVYVVFVFKLEGDSLVFVLFGVVCAYDL